MFVGCWVDLDMERLLLIALLLIVGCSKPIDEESLKDRGGIKYQQDAQEPYSGKVFKLYETGEKFLDGIYKDGYYDGLWTYWYENGKKKSEVAFSGGQWSFYIGKETWWYESGEKSSETIWKDQEEDGLYTRWYPGGQKSEEGTYKDGKKDGKL